MTLRGKPLELLPRPRLEGQPHVPCRRAEQGTRRAWQDRCRPWWEGRTPGRRRPQPAPATVQRRAAGVASPAPTPQRGAKERVPPRRAAAVPGARLGRRKAGADGDARRAAAPLGRARQHVRHVLAQALPFGPARAHAAPGALVAGQAPDAARPRAAAGRGSVGVPRLAAGRRLRRRLSAAPVAGPGAA